MRSLATQIAICLLPLLVLGRAVASDPQPQSYEQRLMDLEKRLKVLEEPPGRPTTFADDDDDPGEGGEDARKDRAELVNRLDKIEDELFAPPSKPTFQVGGRIHADHWAFPEDSAGIGFFENPGTGADPEDRFLFRRIRMEFKGDIFETMNWRMQVDFNNAAVAELKDVYIGFKELPNNQSMRIGISKRPLGQDHLNSSRFNIFLERPLVIEANNEDARRPGIAMWGHSDDDSVGWAYGVFLLENVTRDGRYIGDASQASINARLWGTPWYDECSDGRGFLHLGVAGMIANPDGSRAGIDTNANEARFRTRPSARSNSRWINTGRIAGARYYEVIAAEALLNAGSFSLTSEFQSVFLQRDTFTAGTGDDLFFHGGYVQAGYFLTGESMAFDRRSGTLARLKPYENFFLVDRCRGGVGAGWGALQVAARLQYLDLTSQDIRGGRQYDATLALNWHWTSHSKVQFNMIYGDIDEHAPVGGFTDGHFLIVGTRFAADF